jgi:uncharacterized membrane protein YeaQ/YmgE (transglycosylase-associated protein family)
MANELFRVDPEFLEQVSMTDVLDQGRQLSFGPVQQFLLALGLKESHDGPLVDLHGRLLRGEARRPQPEYYPSASLANRRWFRCANRGERTERTPLTLSGEGGSLLATTVTFWGIVWYIIAGLVIGALARLILPGKQSMSVWMTLLLGVVAAIVGGLVWDAIFPGNDGVAWIGSIIVAVLLLILYERFSATGRGRSTRPPRSALR